MTDNPSKVKRLADAEAARAEAEAPDEEEAQEEAEAQPQESEAAPTESEQPAGGLDAELAGKLERATSNYYRALEKAFGAGKLPPECPHCNGLGFDLTGGAGTPNFQAHEEFHTCAECDGLGQVLTGSRVPGQDLHGCPKCGGQGYLERIVTRQPDGSESVTYGLPTWKGTAAAPPVASATAAPGEAPAWMGNAGQPASP